MYTLLIIDMQTGFSASRKTSVLEKCKDEIRKAIKREAEIIVLEYIDSGKTHPGISRLLKYYPRAHFIEKWENDGSYYIEVFKKDLGLKAPKKILVCGVNTDACVCETIAGMARKKYFKKTKFEIIVKACNSNYDHCDGLRIIDNLNDEWGQRFKLV